MRSARSPPGEDRQQRLNQEERSLHIRGKRAIETGLIPQFDWFQLNHPGVEKQNVDFAERLPDSFRYVLLARRIAGVRGDGHHFAGKLLAHRLQMDRILPMIAIRAPSCKNSRAVSSPMPVVPPVMRARFPSSLSMIFDFPC
jgi:hypothetical protein